MSAVADPGAAVRGWSGEAYNPVPDSPNEIHGDRVARLYGFRGGLVPGVTVSAYLLQPAVEAWGEAFLARGLAHVRVEKPLYDGERFTVRVHDAEPRALRAELLGEDETRRATAEVELPDDPPAPPVRRGDRVAAPDWQGDPATEPRWARLAAEGCAALRYRWDPANRMATYLRDSSAMPALLTGEAPCANASFVLGISNWILATNAHMNPWVHLETTSRFFRAIPSGTEVVAEMEVRGTFERRGHRFVDVTVALFDTRDDGALASIDLRAIYRLRGM